MSEVVEKLQEKVNKGNLASIAMEQGIREYIEASREVAINNLIVNFREGKLGNDLLVQVMKLSELDSMEKFFKMEAIQGQRALMELNKSKEEKELDEYYGY